MLQFIAFFFCFASFMAMLTVISSVPIFLMFFRKKK